MKCYLMKILLFLSIFLLDSLPPESQLFAALDSFHQKQTQVALIEFQVTSKRPTISWSSNLIYSSQKDKERREAKQKSILKKENLNLEKDRLQLRALLQKYHSLKEDIAFLKKLHEYDTQLYEVKQDQAKHLELSPVELLKATQAYEKKEYAIFQKERNLLELASEILIHSHYISH